jgi:hypothetical protein
MINQSNAPIKVALSKFATVFRQFLFWNVIWLLVGTLFGLVVKQLAGTFSELLSWVLFLEVLLLGILAGITISMDKLANNRAEHLEQALKAIAFEQTAHSLGLSGVTEHWTNFIKFNHPYGEQIRERIDKDKGPTTWYIVTVSPEAFEPWRDILRNAVEEKGITVKWAFHAPKALENNEGIKAQWQMMLSRIPNWRDRGGAKGLEHLNARKTWLLQLVSDSQGRWELYESSVPHFFMAFLSVPGEHREILPHQAAPGGTFGFVHLYPMLPADYEARPAIYLEGSGPILDCYYRSIVGLFDEGVKERHYLQRIWPLKEPLQSESAG